MRKRKILLALGAILLLSTACMLTRCGSAQDRKLGNDLPELRSVEEQTQDAATEQAAAKTDQAETDAAPTATEEPQDTAPKATEESQDTEPTIPPMTQTAFALSDQGFFTDKTGDGLDCETGEYASGETPSILDITAARGQYDEESEVYIFEIIFGQVPELDEEFAGMIAIRNPFRHQVKEAPSFLDTLGNMRWMYHHGPGEDLEITHSKVASQDEGWQEISDSAAAGSVEGDTVKLEVPLEEVAPENKEDMNNFSFLVSTQDTTVCDVVGDDLALLMELPVPEMYSQ